ncbi:hypothetical protein [Chondromyces crocatus]|uniref:Uncharacterized protein n=1 Tax=Chondromyces crocatus TaxID=52 RepID=A0A0K1EF12_CHOCO|nr:hypothetical protein [Chondromyces crocatus]AKT39153.1 uncharacterized protein CMC5_033000 [Chondromyces crocatus]
MGSLPFEGGRKAACIRQQGRRSALQTVFALSLGALFSCDGLDNIDVEVSGKAVVRAGTLLEELLDALNIPAFDSIDLTQELENQGVTKDDVDSVIMTQFVLTIEGPPEATFEFLDSVRFYAETSGQPKVLIGKIDEIPAGARQVALELVEGVELKPYVVAPRMKITGEISGRRPKQDTTVVADVVLDVDITIPGC